MNSLAPWLKLACFALAWTLLAPGLPGCATRGKADLANMADKKGVGWGSSLPSVEVLTEAAQQGDAQAQSTLGFVFLFGDLLPENIPKAVEWFEKAAAQGQKEAQLALGHLHFKGLGVPLDSEKALQWFAKAESRRQTPAPKRDSPLWDDKSPLEALAQAAEQGNVEAQFQLGRRYLEGERLQESWTQLHIAQLYSRGEEFHDNEKAVEWFAKAAAQGHAGALFHIGLLYADGKGNLPRNHKEAIKCLTRAANQGDADLQTGLGLVYAYFQDYSKALGWYLKAAKQGHMAAQRELARMHEFGYGVLKDDRRAAEWLEKVAEQGEKEAQQQLGNIYNSLEEYEKAAKWYTQAAQQGEKWAQYHLGEMYARGQGVERDDKKAFEWQSKAAGQGLDWAQHELGKMYLQGRGVAQNVQKGCELLRAAGQNVSSMQREERHELMKPCAD